MASVTSPALDAKTIQWRKLVESKAFCWILENLTVWVVTMIRASLPEPETIKHVDENGKPISFAEKLHRLIRNIAICYHIPHFTQQRRSDSPFTWNAFRDWMQGNWWLQFLGGGLALGVCESFWPDWLVKELKETKFDFLRFVRNFAIFRIVVDLAFYLGHRTLHVHEKIYQLIHKRHHEFYSTNVRANWHFGSVDLFIESAMPIGLGLLTLRMLGIKLGRFEIQLLQDYIAFHEVGTHFNKPVKLISEHPILSILYHPFFPSLDDRAIEFHETHHNRRDVNFGITPWLEKLVLKTAEFQTDILKGVRHVDIT